jgi:heme-degrading monooxygenase HmoA
MEDTMKNFTEQLRRPFYTATMASEVHRNAAEPIAPSDELVSMALRQPGFLGLETVNSEAGEALTVSYWREMSDIQGWRAGSHAGQAYAMEISRVDQ